MTLPVGLEVWVSLKCQAWFDCVLAREFPEIAPFLRGAGVNRIGVRAFSTLEGYAGRNRRNGVGSATADARPPSRFSSEIGTKADAKQQKQDFSARAQFGFLCATVPKPLKAVRS